MFCLPPDPDLRFEVHVLEVSLFFTAVVEMSSALLALTQRFPLVQKPQPRQRLTTHYTIIAKIIRLSGSFVRPLRSSTLYDDIDPSRARTVLCDQTSTMRARGWRFAPISSHGTLCRSIVHVVACLLFLAVPKLAFGWYFARVFASAVLGAGAKAALHSNHSPGLSRLCSLRRVSSDSLARCSRGRMNSTFALTPSGLLFLVLSFFNALAKPVAPRPVVSTLCAFSSKPFQLRTAWCRALVADFLRL